MDRARGHRSLQGREEAARTPAQRHSSTDPVEAERWGAGRRGPTCGWGQGGVALLGAASRALLTTALMHQGYPQPRHGDERVNGRYAAWRPEGSLGPCC